MWALPSYHLYCKMSWMLDVCGGYLLPWCQMNVWNPSCKKLLFEIILLTWSRCPCGSLCEKEEEMCWCWGRLSPSEAPERFKDSCEVGADKMGSRWPSATKTHRRLVIHGVMERTWWSAASMNCILCSGEGREQPNRLCPCTGVQHLIQVV